MYILSTWLFSRALQFLVSSSFYSQLRPKQVVYASPRSCSRTAFCTTSALSSSVPIQQCVLRYLPLYHLIFLVYCFAITQAATACLLIL